MRKPCHRVTIQAIVASGKGIRSPLLVLTVMMASLTIAIRAQADDGAAKGPQSGTIQRPATLEGRVMAVLRTQSHERDHWGLLVVDAKTNQTVYEQNSDQLFAPASVTKLFSTAAALIELGADYRFETPVVRRGEVDAQGTLHGDLVLIAQGDLSMGGRAGADGTLLFKDDDHIYAGGNPRCDIVAADPLAGLDHLARKIRAAGLRAVTGDVIVDDRLFEDTESTGSGPRRVSPIMINDNVLDVLVQPGKRAGEPASVSFLPATQFWTMDAQVETVAADQKADLKVRGIGSRQFTVRGTIPVGQQRLVLIHEVDDPASFARRSSLKHCGIEEFGSMPAFWAPIPQPDWPIDLKLCAFPRLRNTLPLHSGNTSRSSSRSAITFTPVHSPCCWRRGMASERSRRDCADRATCSGTWESIWGVSLSVEGPAARDPTS